MKKEIEIVRIKDIYKIDDFKIYCLFSNEEYRFIDFKDLFEQWAIKESDVEYLLLQKEEFQKVKLSKGTLSWNNIQISLIDSDKKEVKYPYEIDPIVLYQNSKFDQDKIFDNFGMLLRNERIKSGLTQKQLAKKSGISESYISKLENEKSNIELILIRDLMRNGFGKRLKIEVE